MLSVVDNRISLAVYRGEADGVEKPAGNSPRHAVASVWDTTGVAERGMGPEGSLGNVGEPMRLRVEHQA